MSAGAARPESADSAGLRRAADAPPAPRLPPHRGRRWRRARRRAAVAALVWANVSTSSYDDVWSTVFTVGTADHHLALTLREWVNDGLMAVFFFVVGLEIKRELVEGELRDPRRAALPAIAAVGGMIVPALVYVAFNRGGAGADGWGIPMATDIAIAVGVLSLLGSARAVAAEAVRARARDRRRHRCDRRDRRLLLRRPRRARRARRRRCSSVPWCCCAVLGVRPPLAVRDARRRRVAVGPRGRRARHDRGRRARAARADEAVPPARHGRRRQARRRLDGRDRARDRRARARVGVGGRVARAPAAPVDELRDRARVRTRQRGRRAQQRRRSTAPCRRR